MATLSGEERKHLNAEAQARREKHRRENGDEPTAPAAKRVRTNLVLNNNFSSNSSLFAPTSSSFTSGPPEMSMDMGTGPVPLTKSSLKYPHGALRLSRTPGRKDETPGRRKSNTVRPDDLLHSDLVSAFFNCLQYSTAWLRYLESIPRSAIIYHGNHARTDPIAMEAMGLVQWPTKVLEPSWYIQKTALAQAAYRARFGPNFHAVYPLDCLKGTLPHSKVMVLIYPTFMRFVVWYFQDFAPRKPNHIPSPGSIEFQSQMLSHIQSLGAPNSFIASIQNCYDLNGLKCSLVVSAPGTYGGPRTNPGSGNQYGLLRLNALVQSNGFTSDPDNLILNSCTGTTGNLDEGFMRTVHQAACGNLTLQETSLTKDMVVIVYPTRQDVEASIQGRDPACEQGSIRAVAWEQETTDVIKGMFHHYSSKDAGRLFHNKQIFPTLRDAKSDDPPPWMVISSANLSAAAWGTVNRRTTSDTTNFKIKLSTYECGVFIKGEDIVGMLADGDWDEIVPFHRPPVPYRGDDKPWNSDVWVKGKF
ncbi:hypothetical protein C8J56DRAFT_951369 [Mycena floridula]|nr:hypothetical protein C8J56DRAFT_951369 [Mycena floridula]